MRRLIGIGDPDGGDNAAGWEVAGRVTTWSVERRVAGSFDLVNTWTGDDEVIIVDAMHSDERPGTILRFDMSSERPPPCVFSSSDVFGPWDIVALARSLDRMPRTLTIIGIQVEHTHDGVPMSGPVSHAVTRLAWELQHAIGEERAFEVQIYHDVDEASGIGGAD